MLGIRCASWDLNPPRCPERYPFCRARPRHRGYRLRLVDQVDLPIDLLHANFNGPELRGYLLSHFANRRHGHAWQVLDLARLISFLLWGRGSRKVVQKEVALLQNITLGQEVRQSLTFAQVHKGISAVI